MGSQVESPSTALFREYLRIKTVQPNPDYDTCMKFLAREANALGLPYKVTECLPGKPLFVMTWEGTDPSLPAVLLNSHTDVVPVFPEEWKYDPFSAHKDEHGNIFARGSQDMKCVGIQHLEAVRRLKDAGKRLKRTVHLSYVAEEELGGMEGMALFIETQDFKDLNVGFVLDEGIAVPHDVVPVYYGERSVYWLEITCPGSPGHGSRFIENSAGEKAQFMLNKLLGLRERERQKLLNDPSLTVGDVFTVNLTKMEGGVQTNVVPDKFVITFDLRIPPTTDIEKFDQMLSDWATEAGPGVDIKFPFKFVNRNLTSVDPTDPWYSAMLSALEKHKMKVKPEIFPAGTDSRFLRNIGLPCLGFSPMPNTPTLLHDHNEYLNEDVFLKGIDIFTDIVERIANV